jgi:hypothetical protein
MERWSASLDIGEPSAISAADGGMVVVAGTKAVVAFDAAGTPQWRLDRPFIAVRTLPDGRTLLRTPDDVRLVDFVGETLSAWSAKGRFAPQPFFGDRLIDIDPGGVLTCTGLGGTVEWKAELGCRPVYPPLVAGHDVIVSDATGLRLFDAAGTQRFRCQVAPPRGAGTPFAAAEGPIHPFAEGYLAPFRNATSGSGWYLWHAVHAEMFAFAPGASITGPSCVSGELFVAASPDSTDDGQRFLQAYTPTDSQPWKLALPRFVAVEPTAGGGVAILCSPTVDRWDKYRTLHPVENECRVVLVDRAGAIRRDHVVSVPLAEMAAHADGAVYVVRQGTLLAIAVSAS